MSQLVFGSDEYNAIVARASQLSREQLLELTQLVGISFTTSDVTDEQLAEVLDEADSKETVLTYLDEHGV